MAHLNKFATRAEYDEAKFGIDLPAVSLIEETGDVIYDKVNPAIREYLTFEAATDGVDIVAVAALDSVAVPIEVSAGGGKTWTEKTSSEVGTVLATLDTGETLKVRGTHGTGRWDEEEGASVNTCALIASGSCYVYGNIMSLIGGESFEGLDSVGEYQLACAFRDYYGIYSDTNAILIHPTKPLLLPATTLASHCYDQMFQNCTALTAAPVLPATTLAPNCYSEMFSGCAALAVAPALPATTLAQNCYGGMFYGCTALTQAPTLPATALARSCYISMFYGCTSLTQAPELPATTLADHCYSNMFMNCTALTQAPELPAITMVERCYDQMFNGCTALTQAPALPATTLADYCYYRMFYGCTTLTQAPATLPATSLAQCCYYEMFRECSSLTSAPVLPATTLVHRCYVWMFRGCSNLSYIKAMFTTTPGTSYTGGWVNGVAANGTFVKNSAATWDVSGQNGVPTGWTVQTASS